MLLPMQTTFGLSQVSNVDEMIVTVDETMMKQTIIAEEDTKYSSFYKFISSTMKEVYSTTENLGIDRWKVIEDISEKQITENHRIQAEKNVGKNIGNIVLSAIPDSTKHNTHGTNYHKKNN